MFPMCFDLLPSWAFLCVCLGLVRNSIPAAGAVDRELFLLLFVCVCFYSGFEIREVLQKLLGGRDFVLTEYEPLGKHGDPLHAHFNKFGTAIVCPSCLILNIVLFFFVFALLLFCVMFELWLVGCLSFLMDLIVLNVPNYEFVKL